VCDNIKSISMMKYSKYSILNVYQWIYWDIRSLEHIIEPFNLYGEKKTEVSERKTKTIPLKSTQVTLNSDPRLSVLLP